MKSYKYSAFISYRHESPDQEIAQKLHSIIENYHIPSPLKETLGVSKMGRVFRDQEELQLSSDLGEEIRAALRDSQWLICICSPRYLKSKWCLEELDYFISLGRRDHILAILVEKEPIDSFPYSLRYEIIDGVQVEREPLAADVRATSIQESIKKLNNEKLRILAPMLGVNYDDLKQRDRIRKNKIMLITIACAFILLASFLTYVIVKNKQITNERNSALIAESKWLAQSANEALDNGNKNLSLLLSLEALPKDGNNPDRPIVDEAVSALYNALIYGANDQYSAIYDINMPYTKYIGLLDYLAIKNGDEILFYNKTDGKLNPDADVGDLMYKVSFNEMTYKEKAEKDYNSLSDEEKRVLGLDSYFSIHNIYRGENELSTIKAYSTIYLAINSDNKLYLYDSKLIRHTYSVDLAQYRDDGFFKYTWYDFSVPNEEMAIYIDSSADGNYIVSVYSPYVVIWDTASEKINNILFYPDFDKGYFKNINIDPQKSILGILTKSGNVFIYDIDNKKTICCMDNQSIPLDGFYFNVDGTKILAYSTAKNTIMLFNANTGELLQKLNVDFNLESAQYFCIDGYGNATRDDYIVASGKNIIRVYMAGNSSSMEIITSLKETNARTHDNFTTLSLSGETVFTYTTTTSFNKYLCVNDAKTGKVLHRYDIPVFINQTVSLGHNEVFVFGTNNLSKEAEDEYAVTKVFNGSSGEFIETITFIPDFNGDGKADEGTVKTYECKNISYSKQVDALIAEVHKYIDNKYIDSLFILDGKSHELLWNISANLSKHEFEFDENEYEVVGLGYQLIHDGNDMLIIYRCKKKDAPSYTSEGIMGVEIRNVRTGQCKSAYTLNIEYLLNIEYNFVYFVDEENGLLYTRKINISKNKEDDLNSFYDLYSGDLKGQIGYYEYIELYNNKFSKEKYWLFGNHRVRAKDNIVYDIDSNEVVLKFQNNIKILSSSENGEALEIMYTGIDKFSSTCYVVHHTDLNTMIFSANEMLNGRELTLEEKKRYFLE